jgi:hypothetical protein
MATDIIARAIGQSAKDKTDKITVNNNINLDIVSSTLADKVDKVEGKGLSTEDYTTEEKSKLATIADGANNYTHPVSHPPSIIAQDANNRFVSDTEKSYWNDKANGTHQHSKTDISDFPTLATVATSGNYSDLSGKPSIPTVNDTLTSSSTTEALSAKQGKVLKDDLDTHKAEIANQLSDIEGYIGYTTDDIYGVEVDYENKTFARLAGAVGKTPGADFDSILAFGGRYRCNLTDEGVEVAKYGDTGYTETGALTQGYHH